MASPDELGRRIRRARIAAGLSVKKAAELASISRDTWIKVEGGGSVQDPKRHAALRLLELNDDGLPPSVPADTPVTYENLDPRLNNIERQLDLIWQRLESITDDETEDAAPGRSGVVPITRTGGGHDATPETLPRAARQGRSVGRAMRSAQDEAEAGSQDAGEMEPL